MSKKRSLSVHRTIDLGPLRARLDRRREYLELLERELSNTRAAIQEFTQAYNARVAPLERQQARLRKMLDDLAADQAPPPNGWRGGKRSNGANPRHASSNGHSEEERPPKKKAPSKDADYERKVRELFRRLAKQYHPDLVSEADDKAHYSKVMSEINRAYQAKDLEALEALSKSQGMPNAAVSLPEAEQARLELELRQLDTMIFELEQTIRELDLSPAMQMQGDGKERGRRDVLGEMEADMRARISDLEEQLLAFGVEMERIVNRD